LVISVYNDDVWFFFLEVENFLEVQDDVKINKIRLENRMILFVIKYIFLMP